MDPVQVAIHATDPLTHAGLSSYLGAQPEFTVLSGAPLADADVVVAATERVGPRMLATLRALADDTSPPVVLITRAVSEFDLLNVIERRVVAVVAWAADDRLRQAVLAAASGGALLPPELLGGLLRHVDRLHREVLAPRGLSPSGITPREADVLRLMADGKDTAEIAGELCYSQRTVKNVLHGMTSRLKLRNRAHAVAHAMRADVI